MTKRVRKARIPACPGEQINICEEKWKVIEKAYGHNLSPENRARILLVTEVLRRIGNMEREGPSIKGMVAETNTLKNAARSLLQKAGFPPEEDATATSFEFMTERTATEVTKVSNPDLQFLMLVQSMFAGCNTMLRNWEADGGLREGYMWDVWVQFISKVMDAHGMPITARKDTRHTEVNSDFVRLIEELQKHVPAELRRHEQSVDALAGAIIRARKSNWWSSLLPPNLREDLASLLEFSDEREARYAQFRQRLESDSNWVKRGPGFFVSAEMADLMSEGEGQEGGPNNRSDDPD